MKSLKIILLIGLISGYTGKIFSQDSVKTFVEKEVLILGERFFAKEPLLPSSVTILSSSALQLQSGTSVASLIRNIPSVCIRSYGGNGSLQTISTRGMSGEHTAVLVDGESFTNVQNGLIDLGIFSTDDVEQIELVKGGYSSFVGSNAIGGVLNILTKKPDKDFRATLSSSLGSFGFQAHAISLSGGNENMKIKSALSIERSRNDYDFQYSDGMQNYDLKRSGADYIIKNAGLQFATNFLENIETTISARYSFADRGSPSGVSSPYQNNNARLKDDNVFLTSSVKWNNSKRTVVSIFPKLHYFKQNYYNPTFSTHSFSVNKIAGLRFSIQQNFSETNKLRGEIEGQFADVQGSEIAANTRLQGAISIATEHTIVDAERLLVFPSLRIDSYQNLPVALSPKVGMNAQICSAPEIRLRASIGKNFRAPTFNELYYKPGGNPNLHPEKSFSGDVGALLFFNGFGKWKVENNFFLIDTKDRIVWTPSVGSSWSPMNVYRVVSAGTEIMLEHSIADEALLWNASYTYMEVTRKDALGGVSETHNKQLIYTPFESASISAQTVISSFTFSLHHSFTGFRYIQENNNPKYILPEYHTTDIVALSKIILNEHLMLVKVEIQNIFNSHYQWIASYPVPGRSFLLTISFHY